MTASSIPARPAPRAVWIIAIFQGVSALLAIVTGLMILRDDPVFAVVAWVIAALMLVVSVNLKDGAPWARTATLVLQTLAFVTALWRLGQDFVDFNLIIAPAILITLLRNREVLAFFGAGPGAVHRA
jgi:hypothetical protein